MRVCSHLIYSHRFSWNMDINSRMEQWNAANRAFDDKEIEIALTPVAKSDANAEFWMRVSSRLPQGFRKSSFDINSRIDAWKKSENSLSGDAKSFLKSTSPFKKDESLESLDMDLVMAAIMEILDELDRRDEAPESKESEGSSEDKPEPKKEESKDEDSDKKDEEKKDD